MKMMVKGCTLEKSSYTVGINEDMVGTYQLQLVNSN